MTDARDRIIGTRLEFHEALREAFAEAARVGCRELWLSDEDFADWPLGERGVVELLTQWAQPHRRLFVVARHYDEVVRHHARWVQWRMQWSHVVECRALEEAQAGEIPCMLLATDLVCVRLLDTVHHRGRVSHDREDSIRSLELIDAVLQRSVLAFPSTTLGL